MSRSLVCFAVTLMMVYGAVFGAPAFGEDQTIKELERGPRAVPQKVDPGDMQRKSDPPHLKKRPVLRPEPKIDPSKLHVMPRVTNVTPAMTKPKKIITIYGIGFGEQNNTSGGYIESYEGLQSKQYPLTMRHWTDTKCTAVIPVNIPPGPYDVVLTFKRNGKVVESTGGEGAIQVVK